MPGPNASSVQSLSHVRLFATPLTADENEGALGDSGYVLCLD